MDKVEAAFGSLNCVTKGSDSLTKHGERSDLLTCGNQRFIRLLFNTVCNEAKAVKSGRWTPSRSMENFTFVMLGGSSQACVATGKTILRLNSKSMTVSISTIEDEMEKNRVVMREEGEMMVYAAMKIMLQIGWQRVSRRRTSPWPKKVCNTGVQAWQCLCDELRY